MKKVYSLVIYYIIFRATIFVIEILHCARPTTLSNKFKMKVKHSVSDITNSLLLNIFFCVRILCNIKSQMGN